MTTQSKLTKHPKLIFMVKFLAPEIAKKWLFLAPEIATKWRFLAPEISKMGLFQSGPRKSQNGALSGARKRQKVAISGARNLQNGSNSNLAPEIAKMGRFLAPEWAKMVERSYISYDVFWRLGDWTGCACVAAVQSSDGNMVPWICLSMVPWFPPVKKCKGVQKLRVTAMETWYHEYMNMFIDGTMIFSCQKV